MPGIEELLDDLAAEHDALDDVVAGRDDSDWTLPTPAEGWAVRDQISHLAFFDATAVLALTDPRRFAEHKEALFEGAAGAEPDLQRGRTEDPGSLLGEWREGRQHVVRAARTGAAADPKTRVPWYGPDMSLASFITARLMETWAHGQDVRDALGVSPSESERLRHVCHIGVTARPYAFLVHGIDDPGTPVRVEAGAPDGSTWTWGPEAADETITGSALGLALVFTQRRHPADTDVVASGETASMWLSIAQAFAGPAGPGRTPLAGAA